MTKSGIVKLIILLSVIGVVVLGMYLTLHRSEGKEGSQGKNAEAQAILQKDMTRNYPANVREVVRLYSRISQCFYTEKISEDEFGKLLDMQRLMYDEELLEQNPRDTHQLNLQAELERAKKNSYTMIRYQVQKQSSVKEWEADGDKFSSIIACYTMKKDKSYEKTYEEFLLREDENGLWKIVGWRVTTPIDVVD